MKRYEYINDPDVSAFVEWAPNLVTGEWGLDQSWTNGKGKSFECESLYEAYKNYDWPSKVKFADGSIRRTRTFDETSALFDEFRRELKEATDANPATDEDKHSFLENADKIVKWGGINNLESLTNMGRDAPATLKRCAILLDPRNADTENLGIVRYMNASYSKIYSAMIDDFPIYDSRVACALTSMIWLFCKERRCNGVPPLLSLGVPPGRGDTGENRNPSHGLYSFPNIRGAQYRKHADSNLKAAWILGELVKRPGPFRELPEERRVMALQAALFMIGYQPLEKDAIRKV